MDNAGYAALTRQTGLRNEMQVIANNLANVATDGYRREGVVFSEFVVRGESRSDSLSMATAHGRLLDRSQGAIEHTGNPFDLAINGNGYFTVQTPNGDRLTRAGTFAPNAEGLLSGPDGALLLDDGGAPIFVPADATDITVSGDGTLTVDGAPQARIGLTTPEDPTDAVRVKGARFQTEGALLPVDDATITQGALEASNVNPVLEVARMIAVQRAYESGKSLISGEHERIRSTIETLGR